MTDVQSKREHARKARNNLSGARQGTEKWQQSWEVVQTAEQEAVDNDYDWLSVTKVRQ